MSAIGFSGVTRQFGSYVAVRNIDFEVREGSFVSVVGPSGCGKSTLLNLAAGLIEPTSGTIPHLRPTAHRIKLARRLHVPTGRAAAVENGDG